MRRVVELGDRFLRVRLIDPSPEDVETVHHRLGIDVLAIEQPSGDEPDLVVRYQDAAPSSARRGAARPASKVVVTGDEVLLGHPGSGIALPTDGLPTEVRCRRGTGCPEILMPLVTLAAVRRGALPFHATACALGSRGLVVTGRSGVGKTGVLLRALALGAELVAAEHVLLGPDGALIGRREAVRLRPRHRAELTSPALDQSRRLAAWGPVVSAVSALSEWPGLLGRAGGRLRRGVRDRAVLDLPPDSFPAAKGPLGLDSLVLLLAADVSTPEFVPLVAAEAAVRLGILLREEIAGLVELAGTVTHAFGIPDRWGLAEAEQRYRTSATALLADRRLLLVRIPPGELSSAHTGEIVEHLLCHSGVSGEAVSP